MHTLRQNYINVSIRQSVHISGLTGPSSGSGQLHKTIVDLIIISSSWICTLSIYCKSYADKLTRVALRTGDEIRSDDCFMHLCTRRCSVSEALNM